MALRSALPWTRFRTCGICGLVVFLAGTLVSFGADPAVVFSAGEGGFVSIRIPAIISTTNGTLLAFAEGRARNADQASNKIILKRSTDQGTTWSSLQIVADFGADSLNNPCAVVEQKSGRVLLMFQRYAATVREFGKLEEGCESSNTVHSFITSSGDHGLTWSKPRDITCEVKHPSGATTIASGPGIGIQLANGPCAGRLIIPFNEGPPNRWQVYAAWSDDGGERWKTGQNAPGAIVTNAAGKISSRANEVQMVSLNDGSVLLNSRNHAGESRRTKAISRDGGQTWSRLEIVPELLEPVCQASILRLGQDLYYSGPHDPKRRVNGVLFVSHDDGATWKETRTLVPDGFAYSCLIALGDREVGCLYETGGYKTISFLKTRIDRQE